MDALQPKQAIQLSHLVYGTARALQEYETDSGTPFKPPFYSLPNIRRRRIFDQFFVQGFVPIDYFKADTGLLNGTASAFGIMAKGADSAGEFNNAGQSLITIRGTRSWADWGTNFRTMPDSKQGVHIHSGFNRAFQSFAQHIDRYLTGIAPVVFIWLAIAWVGRWPL